MSLTFIPGGAPSYQALSSDIVENKITGASYVGASVYILDTGLWYKIQPDLTLVKMSTSSLGSSDEFIGVIGMSSAQVIASPTLTVGGTYASGDYVGESGVPITFENCARVVGGTGMLKSAILVDEALQSSFLELWLFDDTVTPPADNAPFSLSDLDILKLVGIIVFDQYYATNLNSVAQVHTDPIGFKCNPTSRNLYGCLVSRGTPVFADGDLSVRLNIWQD